MFLKRNHTSPASSASDEGFAAMILVAGSMHVAIGGGAIYDEDCAAPV